jgi:hypothetical protein
MKIGVKIKYDKYLEIEGVVYTYANALSYLARAGAS